MQHPEYTTGITTKKRVYRDYMQTGKTKGGINVKVFHFSMRESIESYKKNLLNTKNELRKKSVIKNRSIGFTENLKSRY